MRERYVDFKHRLIGKTQLLYLLWNCLKDVETFTYFLAPSVLFFSLIWLPWHFLHLVVEIGFLAPHLKHILKNSLRCCAICFFAASVIGIYTVVSSMEGSFLPFCSYYLTGLHKTISFFLLLSYNCLCIPNAMNIINRFNGALPCKTQTPWSHFLFLQH